MDGNGLIPDAIHGGGGEEDISVMNLLEVYFPLCQHTTFASY